MQKVILFHSVLHIAQIGPNALIAEGLPGGLDLSAPKRSLPAAGASKA
jgi:hypothetical protein